MKTSSGLKEKKSSWSEILVAHGRRGGRKEGEEALGKIGNLSNIRQEHKSARGKTEIREEKGG